MIQDIKSSLPSYRGDIALIKRDQSVFHIISEMIAAHKEFSGDYDKISIHFYHNSVKKICDDLYKFCKDNIKYRQEPQERQTTKSPAAILHHGYGDCKHYASFCGGILDSLKRSGKKIDWCYRFASYSFFNSDPEHVFVVVKDRGHEIWIDPTPGAEQAKPIWTINKKISGMPLYRISGTPGQAGQFEFIATDSNIETDLEKAIYLLISYGLMNDRAQISEKRFKDIQSKVDPLTYEKLLHAQRIVLRSAAMGSIFSSIWKGVKKVTLAIPRNAYLSLVAVNAFDMGKKLYNALYNKNGTYTSFKDRLKSKWESYGGSFSSLENAIKSGYRKAKVSGIGAAPAALPAWVAVAGALITAIMPLVNAFLKTRQPQDLPVTDYDTSDYTTPPNPGGGGSLGNNNTLLIVGGIAAVYLLTKKK